MLLQSHNIPAHLFSHQFVPSNSRWHLHRNLYYIYHIDNRTQKYLPGTNRWEKGLLNSYNLFAQLYSIQHYTTFPRTSFPNDSYLANRVGIHIVTCTASITSTTAHKSICQQRIVVKKASCHHTTFARNSILCNTCASFGGYISLNNNFLTCCNVSRNSIWWNDSDHANPSRTTNTTIC